MQPSVPGMKNARGPAVLELDVPRVEVIPLLSCRGPTVLRDAKVSCHPETDDGRQQLLKPQHVVPSIMATLSAASGERTRRQTALLLAQGRRSGKFGP